MIVSNSTPTLFSSFVYGSSNGDVGSLLSSNDNDSDDTKERNQNNQNQLLNNTQTTTDANNIALSNPYTNISTSQLLGVLSNQTNIAQNSISLQQILSYK